MDSGGELYIIAYMTRQAERMLRGNCRESMSLDLYDEIIL